MNKNFKGNDRIGQSKINKQNCKMTIVEYKNSNKIIVEFDDENKTRVNTTYYGFFHGKVRNPNLKDHRQMEYEKQFLEKENYNTQGCLMKIIEYNGNGDVVVEFQDEHKAKKYCALKEFRLGHVMNPYYKSLYGIGYYGGEIPKHSTELDYKCWDTWKRMLERCYSDKRIKIQPTYQNCTVCEEWHNFQNFKIWFSKNFIELQNKDERVCLDKDILVKGNKIYSPETCCFVPNEINVLLTKNNKNRGKYPIGVYYNKRLKKYVSQCSEKIGKEKKTSIYLGAFDTPEEAFQTYKKHKEQYIKKVADKYKDQIKDNVYEALYKWEVEIDD